MRGFTRRISRWASSLPSGQCKAPNGYPARLTCSVVAALLGGCLLFALSLSLAVQSRAGSAGMPFKEAVYVTGVVPQFDEEWTRRVRLTFSNTAQTEDLIDFPVLVVLDGSRIDYNQTQEHGEDLRFVDADGVTLLAYEIERWEKDGTSYVWVKVPQIDGASDTDFVWMYYGNRDAADGQDPAKVWTEAYRMVYHLDEDPSTNGGVILDATARFTATNRGSTDTPGFIGHAQAFDGISQYVDLGRDLAVINQVSAATLSAWIRPDSVNYDGDILGVARYNDGWMTGNSRATIVQRSANVQVYARSRNDDDDFHTIPTLSNPLSKETWRYVVAVVDYGTDTVTIYVDGVPQPTEGDVDFFNSITPAENSPNGAIGSNDDGLSSFFDGIIDEARVAATGRSADWVAAQYLSMIDAFITFGSEEDVGLPVLRLESYVSRDEVYAGSRLDYSLLVSNTGSTARNLVVSDTLPSHTAFGGCGCAPAGWVPAAHVATLGTVQCGSSFMCGLEGDTVVWRMDEMAPNRRYQMTFWVNVDAGLSGGTVIVNDTYGMVADRLTPITINQPVTTTVRELLVSISNVAAPNPVTVGQDLAFTITLENDGSLLQNVTVTDRLPSGVSYVSCGGALCELASGQPEVRWWLPSLPASSQQQLILHVTVDNGAGDALVNDLYGAWVPEAGRFVSGAPITVEVYSSQTLSYSISLPLVLSSATQ